MNYFQALNAGLLANYAGDITPAKVSILGQSAKTVESQLKDDWSYTDQWFGDLQGFGREVVSNQKTGQSAGRVYAGGTIIEAVLSLGLQKSDVISFLIKSIQSRPETRLATPESYKDGDWSYSYAPTPLNPKINLTSGQEEVYYKNTLVFQHNFLISPIK